MRSLLKAFENHLGTTSRQRLRVEVFAMWDERVERKYLFLQNTNESVNHLFSSWKTDGSGMTKVTMVLGLLMILLGYMFHHPSISKTMSSGNS
jgi:hypothetical protein